MGDAGEGLVDNESRIQERMEELQAEREKSGKPRREHSEESQKLGSLKLARMQMSNQLKASGNATRRAQLEKVLQDIDEQMAQLQSKIDRS